MADESRRYERRFASTLASFRHRDADGEVDAEGIATLVDMSLDGACLNSMQPFDVGSRIDLEVQLRDDLVSVSGTVARVSPRPEGEGHEIGISIDRSSPSFAELLRAYFGGS